MLVRESEEKPRAQRKVQWPLTVEEGMEVEIEVERQVQNCVFGAHFGPHGHRGQRGGH